MKDTYFYLPKEKQSRLVPIYGYDANNKFEMNVNAELAGNPDYPKNTDIGHYAGGGGLSSTALDYAIFIQSLLNNGTYNGKRILGRKTIEVMTADQMISLNNKGNGYSQKPGETFCLGFSLITDQGKGLSSRSSGTYEWGGYFTTKFFIDPKEDLIFVGMMQIYNFRHGEFYDRISAILYSAIENWTSEFNEKQLVALMGNQLLFYCVQLAASQFKIIKSPSNIIVTSSFSVKNKI